MINRLMSYTIFIFLICSIIIFLAIYKKTAPTITFFPLDSDTQFEYSDTDLLFSHDKGKKKYQLQWNVHSKSDRNLYLRQDVSLLFANGKLKGVKSKWEEDSAVIEIDETLQSEKEVLWETISFHHGERHLPNDIIKNIQIILHNRLYRIDYLDQQYIQVKDKALNYDKEKIQHIDDNIKKELLSHWDQLITHFNISIANYITVPLTDLYKYNDKNLPNMTKEQTKQILGQLWEGLYKNYIIPYVDTNDNQITNYTPIILFDKQGNHLIVLFELNNKKEMLIQRYSF